MTLSQERTAREVLEDHLKLAQSKDLELDLARNFSADVVLLTSFGVFRGMEGVRRKAKLLAEQLPGGRWTYESVMFEGELGFLEWTAQSETGARVEDGADSYLIRDGLIRAMTIHYTVRDSA